MNLGFKSEYIYWELKKDINDGVYLAGARLPTEFELCKRFSVSRNTLRAALKKLGENGAIESVKGSGCYVKDSAIDCQSVSFMYHGDWDMVIYVQNLLLEKGCLMNLFSQSQQGWNIDIEAEFLEKVLLHRQLGLIASCTPLRPWNEALLRKLESSGSKVVHIEPSRTDKLPEQDYIMPDYYDAGRLAAETLIRKGLERVVFVSTSSMDVPFVALMNKGYKDAVKRHGLKNETSFIDAGKLKSFVAEQDGESGQTGFIALPCLAAQKIAESAPTLAAHIITIELTLDINSLKIPAVKFDRKEILRNAIETIVTPGARIKKLVSGELSYVIQKKFKE